MMAKMVVFLYDFVQLYVLTDDNERIDILDTRGQDIDDSFAALKGVWTTYTLDLSGKTTATLIMECRSTDSRELFGLDNIQFIDE